jgi:hypothetical protein
MAALVFPPSPPIGTLWPDNPGLSGVSQYQYDGAKWNVVTPSVSLGAANQGAYNTYQWPATDGTADQQLTTDGAGNLSWDIPAAPSLQLLQLDRPFDGDPVTGIAFTLETNPGGTPFAPLPTTNLVVFLGGVPQIPSAAYTVSGSTITFTEAPLPGTTFYAFSNVII